jgi:hypothetical protein
MVIPFLNGWPFQCKADSEAKKNNKKIKRKMQ